MTFETQTADRAGLQQLDLVVAKFEEWRQQKTSRAEKIPVSLLEEAQKLTEHLKVSTVRQRLGVTKRQLDAYNDAKNTRKKFVAETDFMQLVPTIANIPPATPSLSIDICTSKGVKISLSGLSEESPLALIKKLLEE